MHYFAIFTDENESTSLFNSFEPTKALRVSFPPDKVWNECFITGLAERVAEVASLAIFMPRNGFNTTCLLVFTLLNGTLVVADE